MKTHAIFLISCLFASACGASDDTGSDSASSSKNQRDSDGPSSASPSGGDPSASQDESANGADESDGDEPHGGEVSSALPVMCESDADCPEGIECVTPSDSDGVGYCNVSEMTVTPDEAENDQTGEDTGGVSLATPAMCESAADCPEGIECVKLLDSDEFGFCNVVEANAEGGADDEAAAEGSGGLSLATPAMCESAADCPEGIECVKLLDSDEFGFCNVVEANADAEAE